jgi:hypothetical protein
VPIGLDGQGNAYFFLIRPLEDTARPRVVALDAQARVAWDRTYEIAIDRADQPQILWNGQGLDLYWLDSRSLYHASLDASGNVTDQPSLLSGTFNVDAYDVAQDANGRVVVWYAGSRRAPGLYALSPSASPDQALLLDPEGVRPDLQYDAEGTLHATWAHYPPGHQGDDRILYGAYASGVVRPGQEATVVEPRFRVSDVVQGPRLGLDGERVYLFWTTLVQTGQSAGMVDTSYVHFARGQPSDRSSVQKLTMPPTHRLDYQAPPGGGLQAGPRVPLQPGFRGTSRVSYIRGNALPAEELAIAFRVEIEYLMRKRAAQVGTAYLREGVPVAYQLLSFTAGNSTAPALASDSAGHIYLTWLERGELPGFMIYLASTAPGIRDALAPLTAQDVGLLAAEVFFGLFSGILFVPFVLIWAIAPLAILGLASLFRREEQGLLSVRNVIALVLALAAYWVAKLVSLPGMREYVPFTAWLPFVPSWMGIPLQWGVPAGIAALGLWAAWYAIYRRGAGRSPFFFLLVYIAVDGMLTMAIYGVLVLSAF